MGVPSDRFGSPDPAVFRSMIQQKSGIPAHIKAKAGVLFPLPAALCFLETPALLIPLDNIKCMELARAGGNSATFDVIVHHKDGRLTEFGMLPREELGPLESYMMTRKIKLGDGEEESASGSEAGSQGGAAGESCGSDESDDEDFDPASSASEEGSGNESDASSDGAEVVSEDDVPSATLRKVMEAEARPTKRKRG
ncbi:hypothetical protein QBZ16_005136 [Prototheca wickerhamii]|uniref:FACT complex subunit SSRP1 n=1 Tax=Prototheca wickerhamii TaxID=3111 RepID=A0AAD9MKS7_PROWI|nr:hypothetical protein QBZ16_005136 [Prototheca wickerhamii]